MKFPRCLYFCPVVLTLAAIASADDSLADWARRRLDEGLVKPLARRETGSRYFSRERPPPRERRVLALHSATRRAAEASVSFAIDVRFGNSEWQQNDIVGWPTAKPATSS